MHFASRLARTIRRPLVLTGLVLLPLGWGAVDAFAKDHAFLINASPSLPNWAFWLDKHARIERGSLIFFEPPASELVEVHFGKGAQLFGMDDQLWNFTVEANPTDLFRSPCTKAGIAQWRVDVTRGKVQDVLLSDITAGLPCHPFFTTFDADGDGRVSTPELQAGFRRSSIPLDDFLARNFVASVDMDRDGTLAESEFAQILAMMMNRGAAESGRRRGLG